MFQCSNMFQWPPTIHLDNPTVERPMLHVFLCKKVTLHHVAIFCNWVISLFLAGSTPIHTTISFRFRETQFKTSPTTEAGRLGTASITSSGLAASTHKGGLDFSICLVDCATSQFQLGQYVDSTDRNTLRTLVAQLQPSEVHGDGFAEWWRMKIWPEPCSLRWVCLKIG